MDSRNPVQGPLSRHSLISPLFPEYGRGLAESGAKAQANRYSHVLSPSITFALLTQCFSGRSATMRSRARFNLPTRFRKRVLSSFIYRPWRQANEKVVESRSAIESPAARRGGWVGAIRLGIGIDSQGGHYFPKFGPAALKFPKPAGHEVSYTSVCSSMTVTLCFRARRSSY